MKHITPLLLVSILVLSSCAPFPHSDILASKMKGSLKVDGLQSANTKLTRKINSGWYGSEVSQCITDQNGRFSFPTIRKIRPIIFLHEPVISQNFFIEINGNTKRILSLSKRDYKRNSELNKLGSRKDLSIQNGILYWSLSLHEN